MSLERVDSAPNTRLCQAGRMRRRAAAALGAVLALTAAACSAEVPSTPQPAPLTTVATTPATPPARVTTAPAAAPPAPAVTWQVGAHPLPLRPDGFGEIEPTPPELVNRALPTKDILPPPSGDRYASTTSAVPPGVLARSTWQAACPVKSTDLRYLTMSFWGFDGRAHTGEMLVNAKGAAGITKVFGQLFAAHFPLEEMRVTSPGELTAPPTGDGNSTSAFVCRPARGQTTWSAHAYGLAVDVNPFCNPYTQGRLVLPELASAYLDRGDRRPGMVLAGDATVRAFAAAGWSWGGAWTSPKDRMHFTATGH
ncbi:D-alanyl-D-alanine carboxypeptidase [Amycolatopsis pretoriensis]|uniref:D-alanyl-D-alanine carboxypeptidase n=2 Tax=Amycolatopsis pretoriensis TaxID=218821 RepID=A0A1H5RAM5_9PSEU|nr:D-alanyl-D-alanine carboxypeptidase [Amycolatopsis pretoriensis]